MMITTSILGWPIALAIWALDGLTLAIALNIVLRRIPTLWASRACAAIAPFTDPLLVRTHRWALRLWPRLPFSWMGLIVLISCLVLKQMLLRILIGVA